MFKWNAEANPEGVCLYATVGASSWSAAGRNPGHRLEFFTGLLPDCDEIASPLAALALYEAREGETLDHGHTVPVGGPIWTGTEMQWFLVLRPRGDIIPSLELPDGSHVEFLQAIPIFDNELGFKARHGAEALLQHWEESATPFWNPGRAPAQLPPR